MSGFREWDQREHASEWILYPDNVGSRLCIDEVSLSDGELYTVLTNADAQCGKGTLIAMVKGVKSETVCKVLKKIPLKKRKTVKEIGADMANNMENIASSCFPNANICTDRFHVAKLVSEAVQHMRVKRRWEAIDKENKLIAEAKKIGQRHRPAVLENGDTLKQLLARSRGLLFKAENKWTESQKVRANLLFKHFPEMQIAYYNSLMLRSVYEQEKTRESAEERIDAWLKIVAHHKFEPFNTASESIQAHKENILNFFDNRMTNALAESFNSAIKSFRAMFRGVRDIPFFIFRLANIYA